MVELSWAGYVGRWESLLLLVLLQPTIDGMKWGDHYNDDYYNNNTDKDNNNNNNNNNNDDDDDDGFLNSWMLDLHNQSNGREVSKHVSV